MPDGKQKCNQKVWSKGTFLNVSKQYDEMFYFHINSYSKVLDRLFCAPLEVVIWKKNYILMLDEKNALKLPWDQIGFNLNTKTILFPFLDAWKSIYTENKIK